jgi:hypothetical protein
MVRGFVQAIYFWRLNFLLLASPVFGQPKRLLCPSPVRLGTGQVRLSAPCVHPCWASPDPPCYACCRPLVYKFYYTKQTTKFESLKALLFFFCIFARPRVCARGNCWRFLLTKSDHQLRDKNMRTTTSCTHMLFILTYFHMYWNIIIIQDTCLEYGKIRAKGTTRKV